MARIAVVGIPGGWSSETLADAVAEATGERILVDLAQARLDLETGRLTCGGRAGGGQAGGEVDLTSLDAVLIKKVAAQYSPQMIDRLEMLRALPARGVLCLSDPERILRLVDRLACTVTLRLAGIPMPATTVTEDAAEALDAVRRYGRAVLKPLFTSKARGMEVLEAEAEDLEAALEAFRAANPVMYVQQAIDLRGQDLGVCFLGGEYLGTYARRKNGEAWSTSTASGGKYAPFDPPREVIELARRAQEPFGLDFTCVDVALTDGGPFVFEVSAFGGFRGLSRACGIDAARLLTQHALRRLGA